MTTRTVEHRVHGVGVGRVVVHGQPVTLFAHGDLTPTESVALFLRFLADAGPVTNDLLLDVADQLDPPTTTAAPAAETGA